MQIQVKNEKNGLKNNDVKWYLSDEGLWVTKYENYADIEKSIANSEGSFNWLYDLNDTVLFEKESGKFETAIINLSKKITATKPENVSIDGYLESKGDIFLAEKKSYSFEFPDKVIYEKEEDCLFSIQKDLRKKNIVILFITDDFGFVIENSILSGWVLKNASKHIYTSQMEEDKSVDAPELLHRYFTALNLYNENDDDTILRDILETINEKEDYMSLEIKECLENIL